jgi:hypothetical protein
MTTADIYYEKGISDKILCWKNKNTYKQSMYLEAALCIQLEAQ